MMKMTGLYQGCLSINVADDNVVQNVNFENIWIDNIEEGQLLILGYYIIQSIAYHPEVVFKILKSKIYIILDMGKIRQ